MPYNELINHRILEILSRWQETFISKKMFGGTCHLLNGNMVCGVYKDFLILRLGEENAVSALREPHTKVFDITGKPMKGWVMVSEEGIKNEDTLEQWLLKAKNFAAALPPK